MSLIKLIIDDPALETANCKPLQECPSLVNDFISGDDLLELIPCSNPEIEYEEFPESFICPSTGEENVEAQDFNEIAAEIPGCNCTLLNNCQFLMEEFVSVQDWDGLKRQKMCGFEGKNPKFCC